MDQQNQTTTATTTTAATSTTAIEPTQPPQQTPQLSQQTSSTTTTNTTVTSSTNPNPTTSTTTQTPTPRPSTVTTNASTTAPQTYGARPPAFARSTWPSAAPVSAPPPRAGGVAIGVPATAAHHPTSTPQPAAFSSPSYAQQGRPGMQGIGMMGTSSSPIRPAGVPVHHQQRPAQPSLRPPSSPSGQPPASASFPPHGLMRPASVGTPASPSPGTSQPLPSPSHQPWLQPVSQGKPPMPSPSYRSPISPQTLQQRQHIPQHHHQTLPTSSTQQHASSTQQQQQQQPSSTHQPQEHYGQQLPPSRLPQSLPHQQIQRVPGAGMQRPPSVPMVQSGTNQTVAQNRMVNIENEETTNRILGKRTIHDLVGQIDPSEKLDPEVEDVLIDIAEDFVESITTFGCSLAKHRKSSTLEAKDILLHLERNWNITLPGYGGDDVKSYRKPLVNDIHKERLAAIKKSITATEATNTKNPTGQAAGNAKSNLSKAT